MEQLKSQICDNVSLYAQKYDEEFQNYLPQFVTDVWNLLVTTGLQPKYDLVCNRLIVLKNINMYSFLQLVSNALQFLSSVAERAHYRKLFEDENVLNSICEKVIIPNMEFRSKSSCLNCCYLGWFSRKIKRKFINTTLNVKTTSTPTKSNT